MADYGRIRWHTDIPDRIANGTVARLEKPAGTGKPTINRSLLVCFSSICHQNNYASHTPSFAGVYKHCPVFYHYSKKQVPQTIPFGRFLNLSTRNRQYGLPAVWNWADANSKSTNLLRLSAVAFCYRCAGMGLLSMSGALLIRRNDESVTSKDSASNTHSLIELIIPKTPNH